MYTVILEPDDNGTLLVTCRDLPEVTTFGGDQEDALRRAGAAIEEALAARIAHGEDIPVPLTLSSRGFCAELDKMYLLCSMFLIS